MNVYLKNVRMDELVEAQKCHPVSGYAPQAYLSNIYTLPFFQECLNRLTQKSEAEHFDRKAWTPNQDQSFEDFLSGILLTGTLNLTFLEENYFTDHCPIRVTLETLNYEDRRLGIQWRKSLFHKHDFFELLYVYRGHCTTTIEGQESVLSAGDICIYNLQAVHQIGISSEEDAVFNVLIKKELFQQTFFHLQGGNSLVSDFFLYSLYHIQAPGQSLVFHPQTGSRCEPILQMMIEESYQNRPMKQDFLKAMLSALFTELFHQYYETICALSRQEPGSVDIAQVIAYIGAHTTSVTLEQTAAHFGYAPRTMIRFLKKHTHSNFRNILQDLRLKKAAVLLRDDSKSIQDIALEIGYSDRSYFHKLFQEHYGVTPAEYRQTLKKSL